MLVDLFVENVGQVGGEDAGGQFYLYHMPLIVQTYHKECGTCGDGRWLRVKLTKVLLAPLC